ncbi:unnamed protein product [Linum trigynum]|uniref:Uncharacterized protein n=1 Tax=Linum trigynum TaxID=586398 RepID=A0AAV2GBF3_9ROSI
MGESEGWMGDAGSHCESRKMEADFGITPTASRDGRIGITPTASRVFAGLTLPLRGRWKPISAFSGRREDEIENQMEEK